MFGKGNPSALKIERHRIRKTCAKTVFTNAGLVAGREGANPFEKQ